MAKKTTSKKSKKQQAWERLAQSELKGRSVDELGFEGADGILVKPLYLSEDTAGLSFVDSIPGAPPFVRGPRATMYAARPWTLRQYAGFSTAEETNAFYLQALRSGQRGLSVAFDLATHRGYDSDHERVAGDVGKAGVAIDSVEDMKLLFSGIDLGKTSVSMTMNGAVLPVLAAYIVVAEEQGVKQEDLTGTIQNDILKEFMVRNTFIYPPQPSMRIVADIIEYASQNMPRYNSVSISGYHMHEAGAPAHLELAFTLADGLEYVRAALSKGLDIDAFAPRLSFFFAIGMSFFTEVAKLRAARLLWCDLLQKAYAPKDPRSLQLRMHCQTSGVSLTEQDPHNNVVRTALEALAAVLGGTQSLHTNAYDEALALPSDHAARIARNTQLILAEESGLTHVVDPLGGSYYVEYLTNALAERARSIIDEIEQLGGMASAVAQGVPKMMIEQAAVRRQARIDRGLDTVVGVNRYRAEEETAVSLRFVDNRSVRERQVERLHQLRQSRDAKSVEQALARVTRAARADSENLLEASVCAMRARATVGEVSLALEQVFGRYEPESRGVHGVYDDVYQGDADWGELKRRVRAFAAQHGRRPRLLVVKLGQDGHDRGARLIATSFADAGFDVDIGPLFQTPEEAARDALDNDVHIVGVSSQAGGHLTLVPRLVRALRAAGANRMLVVCGGVIPANDYPALKEAGVGAILGPGTRVIEAASQVLTALEERLSS